MLTGDALSVEGTESHKSKRYGFAPNLAHSEHGRDLRRWAPLNAGPGFLFHKIFLSSDPERIRTSDVAVPPVARYGAGAAGPFSGQHAARSSMTPPTSRTSTPHSRLDPFRLHRSTCILCSNPLSRQSTELDPTNAGPVSQLLRLTHSKRVDVVVRAEHFVQEPAQRPRL